MTETVLPTHVGMSRPAPVSIMRLGRAPHTRGDEPLLRAAPARQHECSPHTWG